MDLNAKFCLQNRMNILFSLVSCKGIFKIILAYTILYLIISLNTFSESNTDSAPLLNNLKFSVIVNSLNSSLTLNKNRNLSTLKLEKICNFQDYWTKLSKYFYFKSSSAYYIQNSNLIRLFYVAASNSPNITLTAQIEILDKESNSTQSIKTNIRKKIQLYNFMPYKNGLLDIEFRPKNIDLKRKDLILNIHVIESDTNVKIPVTKKLSSQKKNNLPIICAKCFFNMNLSSNYRDLAWWIYLNKKIGYEKIFFCNNSIEHNNLNLLFDKNRNFLDIQRLQCIPNFIDQSLPDFFDSFDSFRSRGVFNYYITDIFNTILINECYLKYSDNFKYITVIDNDETIIPRLIQTTFKSDDNFNFVNSISHTKRSYRQLETYVDTLKCDYNKTNNFVSYLEELERMNELKSSKEYYFQQGYYLSNDRMNQVLNIIETFLNSTNQSSLLIRVNDSKNTDIDGWRFEISGREEMVYARNLCKLNRLYVQPFINKNRELLKNVSENFSRYFVLLTIKDNEFKFGKTVYNTFDDMEQRKICVHSECTRRDKIISTQYGHNSHFRKVFEFAKNIQFSIRQLLFDFNYFNCYIKPVLDANLSDYFSIIN
jgi:hypothetical protein